jgi:hypothetical protein
MFKRLAITGVAKFWPVQPRQMLPRPYQGGPTTYSNDNLPGLRRPAAAGRRRASAPVLTCHWFFRDGRLECRWQVEADTGAPIGGIDEPGATSRISGTSPWRPHSGRLVLAG